MCLTSMRTTMNAIVKHSINDISLKTILYKSDLILVILFKTRFHQN